MSFVKGAWVWDRDNQIGQLRDDGYGDAESGGLLDIVLYDRNGGRVGRTSPACGGPTGFEPACPAECWEVIRKPSFPLPRWQPLRELLRPQA